MQCMHACTSAEKSRGSLMTERCGVGRDSVSEMNVNTFLCYSCDNNLEILNSTLHLPCQHCNRSARTGLFFNARASSYIAVHSSWLAPTRQESGGCENQTLYGSGPDCFRSEAACAKQAGYARLEIMYMCVCTCVYVWYAHTNMHAVMYVCMYTHN